MIFFPELHPRPYRKGNSPGRAVSGDVRQIALRHRGILRDAVAAAPSGRKPPHLGHRGLYLLGLLREDLTANDRAYEAKFSRKYWSDQTGLEQDTITKILRSAAGAGLIVYDRFGKHVHVSFLSRDEYERFVAEEGYGKPTPDQRMTAHRTGTGASTDHHSTGTGVSSSTDTGVSQPRSSTSGTTQKDQETQNERPAEASSLGDSAASLPSTENGHDPSNGHVLTTSDDIERRIAALDI